ncbi:MAG: hypothetical protein GC161_09560 [Planctomycetaceae bacterium]|nr:hypothetical protein [Planctomycetaceae bacterium]
MVVEPLVCGLALVLSGQELVRAPLPPMAFEPVAWRVVAAGEGRQRLMLVGEMGELLLCSERGGLAEGSAGSSLPALADPARTLLDFGQLGRASLGDGKGERGADWLLAVDPRGLFALSLEPIDDGAEPAAWIELARRAKFELRPGAPRFAPFLSDVNADGERDVVLPGDGACELWLAGREDADALPTFRRSGRVRVDVAVTADTATETIGDRLRASFVIPGLETEDLDNDGKPDLLVSDGSRRAYHMQGDDGEFPAEPTVEVDLALYRDPAADSNGGIQFGATLAADGEAQMTRRDLDGDGRADFVLSHGRKVWVFHGGPQGPQFQEPSAILKTADDVTAVVVSRLDDDGFADLLLLRVEVPTIPTLLMGLFVEWDVKTRVSGYRNLDGRSFELRPSMVRDLRLRLPPIFGALRDPFAIVQRFRDAGSKFKSSLRGDFDGDGSQDLLLFSEEQDRVELWWGRGESTLVLDEAELDRILREEILGSGPDVWDLDRLLAWVEGFAAERDRRLTAGSKPDLSFPLPAPGAEPDSKLPPFTVRRAETLHPPGEPAASLLLEWRRPGGPPLFERVSIAP